MLRRREISWRWDSNPRAFAYKASAEPLSYTSVNGAGPSAIWRGVLLTIRTATDQCLRLAFRRCECSHGLCFFAEAHSAAWPSGENTL